MKKHENTNKIAITLSTPAATFLYNELKADGYGIYITKNEYATLRKCSISAVDNYIKSGCGCPDFFKDTNRRNSPVLFRLADVAEYLTRKNNKTA